MTSVALAVGSSTEGGGSWGRGFGVPAWLDSQLCPCLGDPREPLNFSEAVFQLQSGNDRGARLTALWGWSGRCQMPGSSGLEQGTQWLWVVMSSPSARHVLPLDGLVPIMPLVSDKAETRLRLTRDQWVGSGSAGLGAHGRCWSGGRCPL